MALIIQITSHCFTKFMMLILFSIVFYILLFIKITLEVKPCSNGNDS